MRAGKAYTLKSLSLLLIVTTTTVALGFAVAYRWARQTAASAERRPSIALLASNREQDGLSGPVQQVRTETAKLFERSGKMLEAPRRLMELTTYGTGGDRVENSYYLASESASAGKEEYEYDGQSNITGLTVRDARNSIRSKESYQYERDAVGNWTKMTTSTLVLEAGKLNAKPTEVTYRDITYYYDAAIADLIKQNPSLKVEGDDNRVSSAAPAAARPGAQGSGSESREIFASLRGALADWVAANNARDVEKHLSFYAPKLYAYYRARNVSREFVRSDKARLFGRALLIDVQAGAPEIVLDKDGRTALMSFRKQYVVKSSGSERYGEVLQELRWQRTDDRWEIISERDVRVMR